MDTKTYQLITRLCTKYLFKKSHDRHLEDCIQECALMYFNGRTNVKWNVIEYCRINGLDQKRGKQGAKTLESSLSIDAPGLNEDSENSMYLLDQESISRSISGDELLNRKDNIKGVLEEFLSPLKLTSEVMKWVTESYKVKTN